MAGPSLSTEAWLWRCYLGICFGNAQLDHISNRLHFPLLRCWGHEKDTGDGLSVDEADQLSGEAKVSFFSPPGTLL